MRRTFHSPSLAKAAISRPVSATVRLAGPYLDPAGDMCGSLIVIEAGDLAAASAPMMLAAPGRHPERPARDARGDGVDELVAQERVRRRRVDEVDLGEPRLRVLGAPERYRSSNGNLARCDC